MHTIGIDFGTTKTLVSRIKSRTGEPETVRLGQGTDHISTSVFILDDGRMVFGDEADDRLTDSDGVYLRGFKMKLGNSTPVYAQMNEEGELIQYMASDLVTRYLAHIRTRVQNTVFAGEPITRAIITRPVEFSPARCEELRQAAIAAGFEEVELTTEPEAAGLAFCRLNDAQAFRHSALIVDWGGGTLDFALVTREDNRIVTHPNHTAGDTTMGGERFDEMLWNYAEIKLRKQGFNTINPVAMLPIVRKNKEKLSATESTSLRLSYELGTCPPIELTQQLFDTLINESVERAAGKIMQLLEQIPAADKPEMLLLVGGSCRIPYIQRKLEEACHLPAVSWHLSREAVSLGAALWNTESSISTAPAKQPSQPTTPTPSAIPTEPKLPSEKAPIHTNAFSAAHSFLPSKKHPFYSPNGRIGRAQFWIFFLISNLILLLLSILIFGFTPKYNDYLPYYDTCTSFKDYLNFAYYRSIQFFSSGVFFTFLLISFIINFPYVSKRLHDIGHSAWNYTGLGVLNIISVFFWAVYIRTPLFDDAFLSYLYEPGFNFSFHSSFSLDTVVFSIFLTILGLIFSNICFYIYLMLKPQQPTNKYGDNPKALSTKEQQTTPRTKRREANFYITLFILSLISTLCPRNAFSFPISTLLLISVSSAAAFILVFIRMRQNGYLIYLPAAACAFAIAYFALMPIFTDISLAAQTVIWSIIGYAIVTSKSTASVSSPQKVSINTFTLSATLFVLLSINGLYTINTQEELIHTSTFFGREECLIPALTWAVRSISLSTIFGTITLWFITRELYRFARHTGFCNRLTARISASLCACIIDLATVLLICKGNLPWPTFTEVSMYLAQFITYYILLGNEEKPAPTQKLPIAG